MHIKLPFFIPNTFNKILKLTMPKIPRVQDLKLSDFHLIKKYVLLMFK